MTPNQRFRREIFRELRKIDPMLNPGSSTFRAGMVLLASIGVGPNVERIAGVVALPVEFCARVMANARKAGIWRGNNLRVKWLESEHGGFAALLDAMVADGTIARVPDPKRSTAYQQRKAKAQAAGSCSCGRPRDEDGYKTCKACRAAVSKSSSRVRVDHEWTVGVVTNNEPHYTIPERAHKQRQTKVVS